MRGRGYRVGFDAVVGFHESVPRAAGGLHVRRIRIVRELIGAQRHTHSEREQSSRGGGERERTAAQAVSFTCPPACSCFMLPFVVASATRLRAAALRRVPFGSRSGAMT